MQRPRSTLSLGALGEDLFGPVPLQGERERVLGGQRREVQRVKIRSRSRNVKVGTMTPRRLADR
jgi:hypothetical protein